MFLEYCEEIANNEDYKDDVFPCTKAIIIVLILFLEWLQSITKNYTNQEVTEENHN